MEADQQMVLETIDTMKVVIRAARAYGPPIDVVFDDEHRPRDRERDVDERILQQELAQVAAEDCPMLPGDRFRHDEIFRRHREENGASIEGASKRREGEG